MNIQKALIPALLLAIAIPSAAGKDKKRKVTRGMLERMESIPCGAKQRGFTGLGSIFASVGIQAVNSEEKLCPQYLFRTDEMEYHIRPMDKKHAVILPVGHEGEFKIKKNVMYLKVPDGDKKKRAYQVVSMNPVETSEGTESQASYRAGDKPHDYRSPQQPTAKNVPKSSNTTTTSPPQE